MGHSKTAVTLKEKNRGKQNGRTFRGCF